VVFIEYKGLLVGKYNHLIEDDVFPDNEVFEGINVSTTGFFGVR